VEASLPAWYVENLRAGGVVEALIEGDGFRSPSGQANVMPDGQVEVLSTHEQRLGGMNGQVYEGCIFPADPAYAAVIAEHVGRVGEALAAHGVRGRFAVDFAAVRRDEVWDLYALEINLRKGGTTHPYGIARLLLGGTYVPDTGRYVLPDGTTRCYGATDNLVDEAWRDRSPRDVHERLRSADVAYHRDEQVGVVPHLLDCLPLDGRMGYTAIGRDRAEVEQLEAKVEQALR
jgi:PGM1 C-terminal domain